MPLEITPAITIPDEELIERLSKLKAEEEERARQLAAEQKARRDERYASRKKRKKGLRYARPTGAPTNGSDED